MTLTPCTAPSSKLEPHPFSLILPSMTKEEGENLVADIRANGLLQPIVLYQGKILDGNNRWQVLQILKTAVGSFVEFVGTDAQAQAYVISANIHRRHLSSDQRREIIATLLKADPTKSDRQIADTAKASHHTVSDVRSELETTGQVAQLDKTTGADGKARKRKAKAGAKAKKEVVTYQEVINAKTALNAYCVLEENLLDALQDVSEHSDFSQADDLAQRTIEKLQEKLGAMQPEEAVS
jgi:ParB-like chromosome segregation protein Spo0J